MSSPSQSPGSEDSQSPGSEDSQSTGSEDSSSYDRNPSPPPEAQQISDLISQESIGNTAFSKHWLFTTLMKLIEEVDRENEDGTDRNLVVDVDDDLQNELCKLWDMSMNQEVTMFLNEFKAVEILSGIAEKSKAPRVTEICVGILGNMACEPSVCTTMAENQKFVKLMLDMLETRDAPTLVENTRLLSTCLANRETRRSWVRAIQRSEDVLSHLMFIFSSSTNTDLLKNTADLVATLLDLEADLCITWATTDFIESLLEATNQIGSSSTDAMEVYLHILQNFSTTESGVEVLVHHSPLLEKKILKYLDLVCEYEIVSVDRLEVPLSSALSVLHSLLMARTRDQLPHLFTNERLMRILLKILEPLYPMLKKYQEEIATKSGSTVRPTKNTTSKPEVCTNASTNENKLKAGKTRQNGDDVYVGTVDGDDNNRSDGNGDESNIDLTKVDADDGQKNASSKGSDATKDEESEKPNEADSSEEEDFGKLMTLYEIISAFIKDYISLWITDTKSGDTHETSEEETMKEDSGNCDKNANQSAEGETSNEVSANADVSTSDGLMDTQTNFSHEDSINCEAILEYLDSSCSRSRLNYMFLTLRETEQGKALFKQLHKLGERQHKKRLYRIMNDVLQGRIVSRADSSRDDVA